MCPFRKQTAAVALGVLLLCTLRVGAQAGDDTAQKFLTPEQIAQIDQMQTSKNLPRDSKGTVTVHGSVTLSDSQAIPRNLGVNIQCQIPNATTGYYAHVDPDGHYTQQVRPGDLIFSVEMKNYAPAFAGPVTAGPDGNLPPVNIVLSPGFSARIQLADPDGKRVPNAQVSACYIDGFVIGQQTIQTDAQGIGLLTHSASQVPVQIEVAETGYEFDRVKLTLKPDQINTVTLIPEAPTTGTVVDAQTGEVLSGATVRQLFRTGFEQTVSWDNTPPQLLATTDAQGRFTLHSLRRDSQYGLWVSAPGHGSEAFGDIRAGRTDLVWKLGPERVIHGRITGDLSRIKARDPKTRLMVSQITYSNPIMLDGSSYSWQEKLNITVSDGVGTFELHDPRPGQVEFNAADKSVVVKTDNIPALVEIHIDTPAEVAAAPAPTERLVTLKLQIPEGAPAPRGKLWFYYLDPVRHSYNFIEVAVKESTASLEITAPGKIGYAPANLIGYWFAQKLDINVPAGDGPFTWSVPVVPAGVIHGRVTEPDGSPSSNFSITVIELAKSPALGDQYDSRQPFNAGDHTGEYLITPLPLGGRYRLVASSNDRIAMSDEISLDGPSAYSEVNLKFPEGAPIRAKITGPGGQPRAGVSVSLEFSTKPSNGFGGTPKNTGSDGVVTFDHINPDADGTYSLHIASGPDYPGMEVPVKPGGGLINLSLPRGSSLKGRVLDDRTGKPVAHLNVRVWPAQPPYGVNDHMVTTDSDGRFDFENLENRQYAIDIQDADPPGTTTQKNPDGSFSYIRPFNIPTPQAHGGQSQEIILRLVPRN